VAELWTGNLDSEGEKDSCISRCKWRWCHWANVCDIAWAKANTSFI